MKKGLLLLVCVYVTQENTYEVLNAYMYTILQVINYLVLNSL